MLEVNKVKISITGFRHLLLLLLVFFIGLEYWEALKLGPHFTISKALGFLYFVIALLGFKEIFTPNKKLLYPILALLVFYFVYITSSLFSHLIDNYELNFQAIFMPIQFIVFYFLVLLDVNKNPELKNKILISFIMGAMCIYILLMNGIGVHAGKGNEVADSTEGIVRVYFMGMNPNDLGNIAVLSTLSTFYLARDVIVRPFLRYACYLMILPFLHLIVYSGSLGALLALFVGLSIVFVDSRTLQFNTMLAIILVVVLIINLSVSIDIDFLINRLERFLSTGNTTGRVDIWKTNISMVLDHPIIGVGPLSDLRTSHNIFVDAFVWGGFLGLLAYFTFIGVVAKRAIAQTYFYKNSFYFALLVVLVFLLSKSGGAFKIKYIWLYLAIISQLPVKYIKTSI